MVFSNLNRVMTSYSKLFSSIASGESENITKINLRGKCAPAPSPCVALVVKLFSLRGRMITRALQGQKPNGLAGHTRRQLGLELRETSCIPIMLSFQAQVHTTTMLDLNKYTNIDLDRFLVPGIVQVPFNRWTHATWAGSHCSYTQEKISLLDNPIFGCVIFYHSTSSGPPAPSSMSSSCSCSSGRGAERRQLQRSIKASRSRWYFFMLISSTAADGQSVE